MGLDDTFGPHAKEIFIVRRNSPADRAIPGALKHVV
jgi:hypothetical protein